MKKHKGSPALEQIVFEISQKFNIEQIYLNRYDRDVVPNELIILMSNKHLRTLGLLVPQVISTIKNFPNFKVKCYIAFQVKDKIREGNLFLFSSCQPDKLVYQKESSNFTPIANNLNFTKCLENALELTDRELRKIDEFREGYYHFKKIKKYSLAAIYAPSNAGVNVSISGIIAFRQRENNAFYPFPSSPSTGNKCYLYRYF